MNIKCNVLECKNQALKNRLSICGTCRDRSNGDVFSVHLKRCTFKNKSKVRCTRITFGTNVVCSAHGGVSLSVSMLDRMAQAFEPVKVKKEAKVSEEKLKQRAEVLDALVTASVIGSTSILKSKFPNNEAVDKLTKFLITDLGRLVVKFIASIGLNYGADKVTFVNLSQMAEDLNQSASSQLVSTLMEEFMPYLMQNDVLSKIVSLYSSLSEEEEKTDASEEEETIGMDDMATSMPVSGQADLKI